LRAARVVLANEGVGSGEVSILLSDDSTLRNLNRDHRNIDRPTDVLSFPQREESPGAARVGAVSGVPTFVCEILGDVVISVETAWRQAESDGIDPQDELALLAVHGILHLLGYDDSTSGGAETMRDKERRALSAIGIGHPMDREGADSHHKRPKTLRTAGGILS